MANQSRHLSMKIQWENVQSFPSFNASILPIWSLVTDIVLNIDLSDNKGRNKKRKVILGSTVCFVLPINLGETRRCNNGNVLLMPITIYPITIMSHDKLPKAEL